jgi:hypothetical protein
MDNKVALRRLKTIKNDYPNYRCETCDYIASCKSNLTRHCQTEKHKMLTMLTNADQSKHLCGCGKEFQHKQSLYRHKKACTHKGPSDEVVVSVIQNYPYLSNFYPKRLPSSKSCSMKNEIIKTSAPERFVCECGHSYKYQSGLAKHRNKCVARLTLEERTVLAHERNAIASEGLSEKLKVVNEKISKCDAAVNGGNNIGVQNINNTNNSTNINIFLNEKCADALCLEDFISQIRVQLEDLDFTSRHGKRNGLIRILGRELDGVGVHNRPLHCTDVKRQVLYVKDRDEGWVKEKTGERVTKMIESAGAEQCKAIQQWQEAHPDFKKDGKSQDDWLRIVHGTTQELDTTDVKHIVRSLSKNVHFGGEGSDGEH